MSVLTSTFGGVRLSGDDAKKFLRQVNYGKPKKAAQEAAKRGEEMLKEYNEKGYVVIKAACNK